MLNEKQREVLAEKLADFGNIAAGSLIFGTIFRAELLAVVSILIGLTLVLTSYLLSLLLTRRNS